MALPRSRIHGISAAKRERFNGLPALGVPYRSQSLKVTEQEQEQSWLFGAGPGCSPRTYEGRDQRLKPRGRPGESGEGTNAESNPVRYSPIRGLGLA